MFLEPLEQRQLLTTDLNDPPAGGDDSYSVLENQILLITAPGLLANDTDPESDPLTAIHYSGPGNGTVSLNSNGGFTYTPNTDYVGTDSFTYQAHDGALASSLTTVTLTINATPPANQAPVGTDDSYSVNENDVLSVAAPGLLSNDSDPDNDPLTAVLVTGPTNGALYLSADGLFSYTPNTNYVGTDTFTYQAHDGALDSGLTTVTLTVTAAPPSLAANDDAYSVNEDSYLWVNSPGVLGNDTGESLTATIVTYPVNGNVAMNSDGSFNYTPVRNYFGPDSFTYQLAPGVTATVSLTVNPVNDAPTLSWSPSYYSGNEDAQIIDSSGGLLIYASDLDGDTLQAVVSTQPSYGSVTISSYGSFIYSPNQDFNGSDGFLYYVTDSSGAMSTSGSVSLTITPINDVPVAVDDSFTLNEDDLCFTASVLGNDTDADQDILSLSILTGPTHGTVSVLSNGYFHYIPVANFSGNDSFTYQVSDFFGATSSATVHLSVWEMNDAPVGSDDAFSVDEDGTLTVPAAGVLANDTDLDASGPLTAQVHQNPQTGQVQLGLDGSLTYTPNANFHGWDWFSYLAYDGQTSSNLTYVGITVHPVNDAPLVIGESYTLNEDEPLSTGSLLANDSDVEGSYLTTSLLDPPAHGTVSLDGNGYFIYTPNPNYNGPDSFTYLVSDWYAQTMGTVELTVTPVNDAPVAVDDVLTVVDDAIFESNESVLHNDTDVDGNSLVAVLVDAPMHGSVNLGSDGQFTYDPDLVIGSPDFFTYKAFDGITYSDIATVTLISVPSQNVNSPPEAVNDRFTLFDDAPFDFSEADLQVNDYDTDPADQVVFEYFVGQPLHGSIEPLGAGMWRYTPNSGHYGSDEVPYAITDGSLSSKGVVYFTTHRRGVDGGNLFTTVPKLNSFTYWQVPEAREELPGAGIRRNKDTEPVGALDDDLLYSGIQFANSLKLYQSFYTVILRRTSDAIQAWSSETMAASLFPPGVRDFVFPPQAIDLTDYYFYAEWTSDDMSMTRGEITLVFRKPNGDEFIADTLVFHPFKSLVIGFVGEGQSATDQGTGMHMLVDEARYSGFDAMLFDEDDLSYDSVFGYLRAQADDIIRPSDYDDTVGGAGGPPRRSMKAISNAVDKMGVSEIALIGYSHGGGAVLELSIELQGAPDKPLKPFTIPFAAYIDAVKKQSFVGEDRYPVGAASLVNIYQTGPLAPLRAIQGSPIAVLPAAGALLEDDVDSATDSGFAYVGIFDQRQHTNRRGRGIAETRAIRYAVLFGQWGPNVIAFSLTGQVNKF